MGGGQERDHPGEPLDLQPDDLLLAAHLAVVGGEAAGPLAHGQAVLDDPGEVARRDAGGPLALHAPTPTARRSPCGAGGRSARLRPSPRSPPGPPGRRPGRWRRRRGPAPSGPPGPWPRWRWPATPGAGRPTGTGAPPAAAATEARKLLRLVPDHDRVAGGHQLIQRAQQGEVVVDGLAEADARIDPHLVHPGPGGPGGPLEQQGGDLGHHVVVAGVVLHGGRGPLPVHGHPAHRGRAATGHREAETSLIREAPAPTAASATSSLVVSIDTRTWPARASTTGITRRSSSSVGTGSAPGRVDSPPTSTRSAPSSIISWALMIGLFPLEPLPTVRERVRGDIEDAHDQGAVLTGRDGHDDTE